MKPGNHVATLLNGNYANLVRMPWKDAVKIPTNLSFEIAASPPMVFTTAYVSIFDTARLEKGGRILVHAGAGGVGQAAIILSKYVGAGTFVTAGTEEKTALLIEKYGIQPDHIFSSSNLSFGSGILDMTKGKGVAVVLNSPASPLLQEGFNCLAQFGRFAEIGRRDLEINSSLGTDAFNRGSSFAHIDLLQLEQHKGDRIQRVMREIMRLFSNGHISADALYLIVNGVGGIGHSVCQRMAEHGAKILVVL
ncbi:hypothetical protein AAE478_010065 [Parahypoxylon ruwenzoriense]